MKQTRTDRWVPSAPRQSRVLTVKALHVIGALLLATSCSKSKTDARQNGESHAKESAVPHGAVPDPAGPVPDPSRQHQDGSEVNAVPANGRAMTTAQWLDLLATTTDAVARAQIVAAVATTKTEATPAVLRRGISDADFMVRREAIIGAQMTYPALALKDVLLAGLDHDDTATRSESMDKIKMLPPERRAEIYESVIRGNYAADLKSESLKALGNINTKHTCDLLLDIAPALPESLQKEALGTFNYLVRQAFSKPGDASRWWSENQGNFDDTLGFLH